MAARTRYDYIVVGAGTAGAVLANRLTEDPDASVLVLEAGGSDRHLLIAMPVASPLTWKLPRHTWTYQTEAEPGLRGRRLTITRGRTLGGSSSINGTQYVRGNHLDYDLWAQQGLPGWSFEDVLPYFRRMETHWRGHNAFHGGSGPIRVSPVDHPSLIHDVVERAAVAAGFPVNEDYNGATQEGVSRVELSTGSGVRSSTAGAYLAPARRRLNLAVETHALVTRLLVEGGRAVGVEYARGRDLVQARAQHEVLLCAGSFNSPKILMLTGIGSADELKAVGVEPVHDLPGVGRNLSEHPSTGVALSARTDDTYLKYLRLDRVALHGLQWLLNRGGPFAIAPVGTYIYARSRPELARPDLQLMTVGVTVDVMPWLPGLTARPQHRHTLRGGLLHPRSRGWVKLRSADPADPPRVLLNLLAESADVDAMIATLRLARRLFHEQPLADHVDHEIEPGAALDTDDELEDFLRRTVGQRCHAVGTCTMGSHDMAVVDAELRVRGIDGLRVVDASVMPDAPTGNTAAPTIMVAEKAADMIRGRIPAGAAPLPEEGADALPIARRAP